MTISSPKLIILTSQKMRLMNHYGYLTNCYFCNEKLQVAEEVISKRSGKRAKWYHKKCAEKVNLI
jgi:hypothetical protein